MQIKTTKKYNFKFATDRLCLPPQYKCWPINHQCGGIWEWVLWQVIRSRSGTLISVIQFSSVHFSCSVMSDSVTPWTAAACSASLSPGVCSNSSPSSQCCHPTISSSVALFSCLQYFPASGPFPMSPLFTSGGHSVGASALASVLPMGYCFFTY